MTHYLLGLMVPFLPLFYDIACGEEADFSLPTSHLLNLKYQILYRVVSTYVIFW